MMSPSATRNCLPPVSMIAYITTERYHVAPFAVNANGGSPTPPGAGEAAGRTVSSSPMSAAAEREAGSFEAALAACTAEPLAESHELSAAFRRDGWVPLGRLLEAVWEERLRREAHDLVASAALRRDVTVGVTGNSPRRMEIVGQSMIAAHGGLLPRLYAAESILALVAAVAGRPVRRCPYEPERFILSVLAKPGDTHGWHWDDYPYALVFIVDGPAPGGGGLLEFVPRTVWNKDDPRVAAFVRRGPVGRAHLRSGDAYLLRSDTTLHRVSELGPGSGRRIAFAMAFADVDDDRIVTHETTECLYGSSVPAGATRATEASIQARYSREPRSSTIAISGSS